MKGNKKQKQRKSLKIILRRNWQLYVMVLPVIIYYFVFQYMPMYGVQIAFKNYRAVDGIMGSPWVGLKHFKTFIDSYYFERLIKNTVLLNVYGLLWGFPFPIVIAILLNRIRNERRRRVTQTIIYVPHFISTSVMAGMLYIFLSPSSGIFNAIGVAMGGTPVDYMSEAGAFRSIYIISSLWQGAGYSSILYIATLTSIDPSLYEAAEIDGASMWQKIRYIDLPALVPTAMIRLILDCGTMLSSNTGKALIMQTPGNIRTSELIGTYVYNMGIGGGEFSYTTAIGLFVNVINFIMIISCNKIAKKVSDVGLF